MRKLRGDQEKPDGLEITSIGSLYAGPWDKKYWSSSRGKDRYPYPVGYQAVRAYDEVTYKMEIHEGPKGPLFMVASGDGHSCSGQTPDIAWDQFQKKYSPRIKIWQGNRKRFSSNINAVEFFGFKNPSVQRLIREMVANISGSAEHTVSPPSFSKEAVKKTDCKSPYSDARKSHNEPSSSHTPKITGKRSKRQRITKTVSSTKADLERSRHQDPSCVAEAPNPTKEDQRTLDIGKTINSLDRDHCEILPLLPQSVDLRDGQEEKCQVAGNDASLVNVDNFKQQRDSFSNEEVTLPVDLRHCLGTDQAGNFPMVEKPLDRSQTAEMDIVSFPLSLQEVKDGEIAGSVNSQILNYAPDSFDVEQDDIPDTDPSACDKVNEKSSNEVKISSEDPRSNPDEDTGTSNSNMGTAKTDSDSVGHETTKSMMAFLLPQAVPLLKKTSKKKKVAVNDQKKQTETDSPTSGFTEKNMLDMKADMNAGSPTIGSAIAEAKMCGEVSDETTFSAETRLCDKCGLFLGNGDHNDSLDCYLETHGSKDILYQCDASNFIPPLCDGASVPIQSCSEPCKISSSAEVRDTGVGLVEKTEVMVTELRGLVHGLLHSSTEQRDQPVTKTEGAEAATVPVSHVQKLVYTRRKKLKADNQTKEIYSRALSESIICRKFVDDSITETCETSSHSVAVEALETSSTGDKSREKDSSDAQHENPEEFKSSIGDGPTNDQKQEKCVSNSSLFRKDFQAKKDFGGIFETVGCYLQPLPVLFMMVSTGSGEIRMCVVCGNQFSNKTTLYMYNIATEEATFGYPSFIGHTSLTFPNHKDYFGRETSLGRSGLQFTPDGQHLVMIDSIRTPHCSQGRIPCQCSECASESFEGDAVKIVRVESGYVSVVTKLKADESLKCLLVCEPNHLVAAGESGRLHLWVMNSIWSEHTETFIMPASDRMSPGIVGLKRIPTCASLVIGHNGIGEFSLWDISKCHIVSKFSGSSTSVFDFIPVGLFQWEKNDHIYNKYGVNGHVNRMIAATNERFSEQTENGLFLPSDEDIAVWLLVSVISDSDHEPDYMSGDYETKSARCWKLVLLLKNRVILGSALDPSVTAVGTSGCHGIIGTGGGFVFIWDMLTGTKLGNLHHFKGNRVSCIATDGSKKGAVAVAGDDGQLVVYVASQSEMVK